MSVALEQPNDITSIRENMPDKQDTDSHPSGPDSQVNTLTNLKINRRDMLEVIVGGTLGVNTATGLYKLGQFLNTSIINPTKASPIESVPGKVMLEDYNNARGTEGLPENEIVFSDLMYDKVYELVGTPLTFRYGKESFRHYASKILRLWFVTQDMNKPQEKDHYERFASFLKDMGRLAQSEGVLLEEATWMFTMSSDNNPTSRYKDEVASEASRTLARKMYSRFPGFALNTLAKANDNFVISNYDIARALGPITIGLHDMEIGKYAESLEQNPNIKAEFKAKYPKEAMAFEAVLRARRNLAKRQESLAEDIQTVGSDEKFMKIVRDKRFIRSVITKKLTSDTGEEKVTFHPWLMVTTSSAWAHLHTEDHPWGPDQETYKKLIDDVVSFYSENPERFLSEQVGNSNMQALLKEMANSQRSKSAATMLNSYSSVRKADSLVRDVESRVEPVIIARDRDEEFQNMICTSYACGRIKAGKKALFEIEKEYPKLTLDHVWDYKASLFFFANGSREISSALQLSERSGLVPSDYPYASDQDIYDGIKKLIEYDFDHPELTQDLLSTYFHLVGPTSRGHRFSPFNQSIPWIIKKLEIIRSVGHEKVERLDGEYSKLYQQVIGSYSSWTRAIDLYLKHITDLSA